MLTSHRTRGRISWRMIATCALIGPTVAWASGDDPVSPVALGLALILVAAKIGGDLAIRVGQPSVLGELMIGVLMGNLGLLGLTLFEPLKVDVHIDMLSRLGVIILLFEVGLESTVAQMLKVGVSSLMVAVVGVVVPFVLGFLVGRLLLPEASDYVHAFLGASLCATSVGITARVLKDLDKSQTPEARIILGAAVIDDVLGLVILAVVTGIVAAADVGGEMSVRSIGTIVLKASAFLVGALVLGVWLSPRVFRVASMLRARGVLLALALAFCLLLSWLAGFLGLAPIVGAFAAGLVLEDAHFEDFKSRGEHTLDELIHPIASFLVPVFFVLMGMRTDLKSFTEPGVLTLASALVAVAIIGKQACALGARGPGLDRLSVGIGMIPRGEVGLIFANIGLTLHVGGERIVSPALFSATVVMVIVTTMVTPPALKWSLNRKRSPAPS